MKIVKTVDAQVHKHVDWLFSLSISMKNIRTRKNVATFCMISQDDCCKVDWMFFKCSSSHHSLSRRHSVSGHSAAAYWSWPSRLHFSHQSHWFPCTAPRAPLTGTLICYSISRRLWPDVNEEDWWSSLDCVSCLSIALRAWVRASVCVCLLLLALYMKKTLSPIIDNWWPACD